MIRILLKNPVFYRLLIIFIFFGCHSQRQLSGRNCKIICYEKNNDVAVYSTRCPEDPVVLLNDDTVKVTFTIKHNQFNATYGPFQKINENLKKYNYCMIDINGQGRFR